MQVAFIVLLKSVIVKIIFFYEWDYDLLLLEK